MNQKFSKKQALQFGWKTMKSNFGFFIELLIIAALFFIIPGFIAERAIKADVFLGVVFYSIDFVLTIIISMGLTKVALIFCDGQKARLADLFSQCRLFFTYLFGAILYALIVLGGAVLLVVPGIILGMKFWFVDYFIIDKGFGPIKALKNSWNITKGIKLDLFIFFLLLAGINLLGILCLAVGLFVTVPTTMLAAAFVYRKLLKC